MSWINVLSALPPALPFTQRIKAIRDIGEKFIAEYAIVWNVKGQPAEFRDSGVEFWWRDEDTQ